MSKCYPPLWRLYAWVKTCVCLGVYLFLGFGVAHAETIPPDLLLRSQQLAQRLTLAYQQQNPDAPLPSVSTPSDKRLEHVYGKAIELAYKFEVLRSGDLSVSSRSLLKTRSIDADQVSGLLLDLDSQLVEILRAKQLSTTELVIEPVGMTGSYAEIYQNLWLASLLTDQLGASRDLAWLYARALQTLAAVKQLAAFKQLDYQVELPQVSFDAPIGDAHLLAFKSLHKLLRIERQLDIEPLVVESYPLGDIDQDQFEDALNVLSTELLFLQARLKLGSDSYLHPEGQFSNKLADLIALMRVIDTGLQRILESS